MDFNVSTNLYQKENVIEVINIIKKILIVDDAVMNRKMLIKMVFYYNKMLILNYLINVLQIKI